MSLILWAELYEEGTGQVIGYEPYEVPDEEIQREQQKESLREILVESAPVQGLPQLYEAVRLLSRLLGVLSSPP